MITFDCCTHCTHAGAMSHQFPCYLCNPHIEASEDVRIVNDIETEQDFHTACLVLRRKIQRGEEVDWNTISTLAVKGQLIAARTGQPLAFSFQRTYSAEPDGDTAVLPPVGADDETTVIPAVRE